MQRLLNAHIGAPPADSCAEGLLAALPYVMRFIRTEVQRHRAGELTMPQFRALVFVTHNDNASLSELAEHLGLSMPAASRTVDLLVKRGLLNRRTRSNDRRSVSLSLTKRGQASVQTVERIIREALVGRFKAIPPADLAAVQQATTILHRVFEPRNCQEEATR